MSHTVYNLISCQTGELANTVSGNTEDCWNCGICPKTIIEVIRQWSDEPTEFPFQAIGEWMAKKAEIGDMIIVERMNKNFFVAIPGKQVVKLNLPQVGLWKKASKEERVSMAISMFQSGVW